MGKVVFIGNGVNYKENEYTWEDLLRDLITLVEKGDIINVKEKPFPLLYEEIVLRAIKYTSKKEEDILKEVIERIENLKVNDYHEKIVNLDVTDIITTNYDLLLERAQHVSKSKVSFELSKNLSKKYEKGFNFYTYSLVKEKKIWHIHGTIKNQNSLILGHKKYSENISKMIDLFKNKSNEKHSWLELMMEKEVHIFGFALDIVEIDIWFLLNERARRKSNNKISYYYPKFEKTIEQNYKDDNISLKIKKVKNIQLENRLSLLKSHCVDVIEIDCDNYDVFYEKIIKRIEI